MVGEIVDTGAGVSKFSLGDRVFLGGTHKEYEIALAEDVIKIPDSIPTDQAVLLNLLGIAHIALRTGTPNPGENVAVVGLGVIGQSVLAWCRAFGFQTIGIDMDGSRLEIAEAMGAHAAISPVDNNFQSILDDVFCGNGADLVIEAASTWKAIQTSMAIARKDGKVVIIARHTDQPHYNLVRHPYLSKRLTLKTAYGYEEQGQRWDRISWQELPEIYRRLNEGDSGILGVIVDWT